MIAFEADRKIQVLQDNIPSLIAAAHAALPETIPQRIGEVHHWRTTRFAGE